VVVPSFEHEAFVVEALRSIAEQTYPDIELILIDDQSSDATYDRALAFLRGCAVPFCALRVAHAGLETNLNAGIQLAHGAWVSFLASDDIFPRDAIEVLMAGTRGGSVDVVVGPVAEVRRDGSFKASRAETVARYSLLSGDALRKALLEQHGSMLIQGMLISRRVFAQVGLYDPELFASDFDFLLRMASREVRFAFVRQVTALHRDTRSKPSRAHLLRSLSSHLVIAKRRARSTSEYRRAASRFYCETAFTSFHFGYAWDAATYFLSAMLMSMPTAIRLVSSRISTRMRPGPRHGAS
jgi:glycosyltransferase involved in cell wall biosynthesis